MSSPRRPVAPRSGPPRPGSRAPSRRPAAPRASASRPASRTTGAAATGSTTGQLKGRTPETHQPPRRLVTVRSLVLLVVVAFAFSLVVPTVRSFLAQRADVAALERDVAAARTRNADLDAELLRWDDPAYVAAQARERLAYVLPGEVAYRVIDPEVVDTTPEDTGPVEPETPSSGILLPASDVPWFESIWESVQVAGRSDDAVPEQPGIGTAVDGTSPTDDGASDESAADDATGDESP